jgi:hypothetical protein
MADQTTPAEGPVFREIKTSSAPEKTYVYRPLSGLTKWVAGLCIIKAVAMAVQAVALLGQGEVLQRMARSDFASREAMMEAANASDVLVGLASLVTLAVLITTYVVAGVWVYRAGANVRTFGAKGLQDSPGWAVGWYAIPIMQWFRPFMAMTEIWKASGDPLSWSAQRTPALLGGWWAFWVLTNILGTIVWAGSRVDEDDPSAMAAMTYLTIADLIVDVVATVLFMMVVLSVNRRQSGARQVADVFA